MNKGTVRTCLFLCTVLALLLLLGLLPGETVGEYEIKRVDIVADLRPAQEVPGVVMPPAVAAAQAARRDTCPAGMTCIEDYGDTTGHGMAPFYDALAARGSLGRPVRIAYFGDSFIEGDILTDELRRLLQERYGGCGVGFVDIASPFIKLRGNVRHSATGWSEHNVLEKGGLVTARLGLSCRYADGQAGSKVSYTAVGAEGATPAFDRATLYLTAAAPLTVSATAGDAEPVALTAGGSGEVEALTLEGPMTRAAFTLGAPATCYGVALEGRSGVVLDNFSLRGSSGTPLASVPESHLRQMARVRPYDLVVLQFGLNVAAKKQLKYDNYVRSMKTVIRHFRQAFPEAAILVVSIGDREDRTDGRLCTMPGVKALVGYQQMMAAEEGVAFWNLYEAMGGEGAIRRMAEAKPAEAGRDYTHINRRGGKRLAGILFKTLVHGYSQSRRP